MASDQMMDNSFGFKTIRLFKDQPLGRGSYGRVYRAQCDDLPCAAKLLLAYGILLDTHPTSQAASPHETESLPIQRFDQEFQFLSTTRHPNLVQYLGVYQDPETGLPALLMELMDDNLTHFLEKSTKPIPYHIQVNICHDIALALSFLHSNNIIHRNLSSNNVLMIGNVRAKVTDFGMAKLGDQSPRATHLTFAMCPGTDVFMPPEAVRNRPVYTDKIDCFSFGVITLQILTQKFPEPTERRVEVQLVQPDLPCGTYERIVPEAERRQNHIKEVDLNHTLLQMILDCLKDKSIERPTTRELCERLSTLRKSQEYHKCIREVSVKHASDEISNNENEELRSLKSKFDQTHAELKRKEDEINQLKREKDEAVCQLEKEKDEAIGHIEREKDEAVEEKDRLERELHQLQQQLKESEHATETRSQNNIANSGKEERVTTIKVTWREGMQAPYALKNEDNSVVVSDGNSLYFRSSTRSSTFYQCTRTADGFNWSQLPDSPTKECPSLILNKTLTVIGGRTCQHNIQTSSLYSLTGNGSDRRKWTESFPSMPMKRYNSAAVCTETALIVAGGETELDGASKTVVVMNLETHQWSTVADLPQSFTLATAICCGDHIYIFNEWYKNSCTCSISALIHSSRSTSTTVEWSKIPQPPVTQTCYTSFQDKLLLIGGCPISVCNLRTSSVYMYNLSTKSWEDILPGVAVARSNCFAGVLPNNQLMVVGGINSSGNKTNSVEIATIELC